MKPVIDKEMCKGCGLCVSFCAKKCIEISKDVNLKGYSYAVYREGCIGCRYCSLMCPDSCIEIEK